jgi:hypothetical protein
MAAKVALGSEKKIPYKYESRFGSHKSMVIEELVDGNVVCEDEFGKYQTKASNVDNGSADPNRFDLTRRKVKLS